MGADKLPVVIQASMRPARKGPENPGPSPRASIRGGTSFNEAGPQGAGKPPRFPSPPPGQAPGFNEAGPQGAGKPQGPIQEVEQVRRFNEAGPQGAGKP